MKHNQASYSLLFSELKGDIDLLTRKIEKIEPDEFDFSALGYTIHNIYKLMENYFLRITKFFENNITHFTDAHARFLEKLEIIASELS